MSSGPQQPPPPRRVTNVGSLLLTPQENESLFTFLGKKCVVSGRDPCRRVLLCLLGRGWRAGKWEWGRRRERRGEDRAAGLASRGPVSVSAPSGRVSWVRAGAAGRHLPDLSWEQGSVTSAGLPWSPAWPGPGPCPGCWLKLYKQSSQGDFLAGPA